MNSEILINKLMNYFNVFSMHELAVKLNISQPAISKWKKNNSVIAIKKKCRELGIYNEIFDEKEKIYDEMNLKFNISQKRNFLKEQCKKYDIQVTKIENKRLLYLFEQIDSLGYNKIDEVEKDLKEILFKIQKDSYYVRTYGRDKYLENLERNQKEYLEKNIEEQKY